MVRHITAQYIGEGDTYYQRGRNYPLAVKIGFFTKKVQIYKRRGYYDEMEPGTHRVYKNLETFDNDWGNIREEQR